MSSLHSAYAEQRISIADPPVPTSDAGARRLGSAYWEEVSSYSLGIVRRRHRAGGTELSLLGLVPLLRFGPPGTIVADDRVECRYPIEGGLLAAGPGGFLVLSQRGTGPAEVSVAVEEFHSRLAVDGRIGLRRRLFDALQAPLHAGIGRRYLARAARGPL